MTSAQVVETSVTITDNSPSQTQDYTHPDDQNTLLTVVYLIRPYPSALLSNTRLADECHRLDCKRLFPVLLESGRATNLQLSVIQDLLREVSCLIPD